MHICHIMNPAFNNEHLFLARGTACFRDKCRTLLPSLYLSEKGFPLGIVVSSDAARRVVQLLHLKNPNAFLSDQLRICKKIEEFFIFFVKNHEDFKEKLNGASIYERAISILNILTSDYALYIRVYRLVMEIADNELLILLEQRREEVKSLGY